YDAYLELRETHLAVITMILTGITYSIGDYLRQRIEILTGAREKMSWEHLIRWTMLSVGLFGFMFGYLWHDLCLLENDTQKWTKIASDQFILTPLCFLPCGTTLINWFVEKMPFIQAVKDAAIKWSRTYFFVLCLWPWALPLCYFVFAEKAPVLPIGIISILWSTIWSFIMSRPEDQASRIFMRNYKIYAFGRYIWTAALIGTLLIYPSWQYAMVCAMAISWSIYYGFKILEVKDKHQEAVVLKLARLRETTSRLKDFSQRLSEQYLQEPESPRAAEGPLDGSIKSAGSGKPKTTPILEQAEIFWNLAVLLSEKPLTVSRLSIIQPTLNEFISSTNPLIPADLYRQAQNLNSEIDCLLEENANLTPPESPDLTNEDIVAQEELRPPKRKIRPLLRMIRGAISSLCTITTEKVHTLYKMRKEVMVSVLTIGFAILAGWHFFDYFEGLKGWALVLGTVVVSCITNGIADYLRQRIRIVFGLQKRTDWVHVLRWLLISSISRGLIFGYLWHNVCLMENDSQKVAKIILDLCIFAPLFNLHFILFIGRWLVEKTSINEALEYAMSRWLRSLIIVFFIWPWAMPLCYFVFSKSAPYLSVAIFGLFWSTILSFLVAKEGEQDPRIFERNYKIWTRSSFVCVPIITAAYFYYFSIPLAIYCVIAASGATFFMYRTGKVRAEVIARKAEEAAVAVPRKVAFMQKATAKSRRLKEIKKEVADLSLQLTGIYLKSLDPQDAGPATGHHPKEYLHRLASAA
ncbi:MAG: hypothetical protein HQ558_03240, partial [Candidatus Omnitrophica bacterium]|nr:hypothetical protein [Candidatus Omnitrophota bacterium]